MNYKKNDYVIFMDTVGHTFLGKYNDETDDFICIENPLIISSEEKKETGGMNIQFYPILFREFQADKNQSSVWYVPKHTTTWMNTQPLEVRLTSQYERIFSPIKNVMPLTQPNMNLVAQPPQSTPTVIKLFDN